MWPELRSGSSSSVLVVGEGERHFSNEAHLGRCSWSSSGIRARVASTVSTSVQTLAVVRTRRSYGAMRGEDLNAYWHRLVAACSKAFDRDMMLGECLKLHSGSPLLPTHSCLQWLLDPSYLKKRCRHTPVLLLVLGSLLRLLERRE